MFEYARDGHTTAIKSSSFFAITGTTTLFCCCVFGEEIESEEMEEREFEVGNLGLDEMEVVFEGKRGERKFRRDEVEEAIDM